MEYEELLDLEKKHFAQVFSRLPIILERGKGVYVFDEKGKKYIDMFSGVAVSSVGHGHPKVIKSLKSQAEKLIHVSNWVYSEPQIKLAKKVCEISGLERVFFTNDGSGAIESAIKLARKVTGKKGIVAFENGFHGRSMGALSATWTKKYRNPFEPLIPGFRFAKYDDVGSLREQLDDDTAAILIEPIQGEAGIRIPSKDYLKEVREIADDRGVLLILDEIQTGFGRVGHWFDYQRAGIMPDILCMAKGLGGGFPIGAIAYRGFDFEKGEHGGTFNGNPLACTVALTVIDIIEKEKLVENSAKMGSYILKGLEGLDAWGRGLMIGVGVESGINSTLDVLKHGGLCIYSGNTLRILPPLILKKPEAELIISIINEVVDGKR